MSRRKDEPVQLELPPELTAFWDEIASWEVPDASEERDGHRDAV